MPSILPDFEYDIFISYRQKDNKVDGWVSAFVAALRDELDATVKTSVSIYFDENPHDGLLETHQVNASLDRKLKCIIFMPIVSQTYCDTASYAWQNEFLKFMEIAEADTLGMHVNLANGNVASRVLPIQIHELDSEDRGAIDSVLGGPMRAIPFIYAAPGVNRPLLPHEEHPENNKNKTTYRDQINKVANAIKEIGAAVRNQNVRRDAADQPTREIKADGKRRGWRKLVTPLLLLTVLALVVRHYYVQYFEGDLAASQSSVAVIPFRNGTGDPGMSHYGVGIASEVSTKLGLTKKFNLISSLQATIKYQESDKSPAEIAKELGVTHILTGMYQTAGENIQVVVELVDITGKVIWNISYKTRYSDLFDVQAKIASKVMDKFSINNVEQATLHTPDLEAYTHEIKGLEIVLKSNVPEDRMKAVSEYQQAIALDSGFIDPWWGIIEEYCYYYWNRGSQTTITLEMIEPYLEYVKNNFPDSWKKKAALGTYEYWALAHYQKGLDLFLEVLDEAPQDGGVHSMVSAIYRRQLKLNESFKHIAVSIKQNPGAVIYWHELLAVTSINGDYDKSIKAATAVYELNNSLTASLYRLRMWTGTLEKLPEQIKRRAGLRYQVDLLLEQRKVNEMLVLVKHAPDSAMEEAARLYYQVIGHYLLKQNDQVKQLGKKYLQLKDQNNTHVAYVTAILRQRKDFDAIITFVGRSEEDLSEKWNKETDKIIYATLSSDYAAAVKLLKETNEAFPQVGDYAWLSLPIFDRARQEYPALQTTINELKLPPKIMDTQLIKM